MEEKKKEINLLLEKLDNFCLRKYKVISLSNNRYFRKRKKYYLGNNYTPSHKLGFIFNPFNRKVRKLLKEDYIIKLRLNHSDYKEFLIQNLNDLESFYKDPEFFFQM